MHSKYLLFFFVLLPRVIFSQASYQVGYVVTLENDTLKGYIEDKNWANNPKEIYFKEKLDLVQYSKFTPAGIKAFGVGNEIFESARAQVIDDKIQTIDKDSEKEPKLKTETVFLQCVVKGVKSLYQYTAAENSLFYIRTDTAFELLIYHQYRKIQDGRTLKAVNNKYWGQLASYLKECSTIQSKLKNLTYSRSGIVDIFSTYYACTNSKVTFKGQSKKSSVEFGLLGGLSITSLKFSSSSPGYDQVVLQGSTYTQSINFTGACFLDIRQSGNLGKWSLNNELMYTNYLCEGTYNGGFGLVKTKIGYGYVKLNIMLRYRIYIKKFVGFFNAGITNGLVISETNIKEAAGVTKTAITDPRKYEQGYLIGLGAIKEKMSFQMRLEMANGMSNQVDLSSSTARYSFLVGYRF